MIGILKKRNVPVEVKRPEVVMSPWPAAGEKRVNNNFLLVGYSTAVAGSADCAAGTDGTSGTDSEGAATASVTASAAAGASATGSEMSGVTLG